MALFVLLRYDVDQTMVCKAKLVGYVDDANGNNRTLLNTRQCVFVFRIALWIPIFAKYQQADTCRELSSDCMDGVLRKIPKSLA